MTTVVQTQTLKLNQIRIDGGTQSRVDIDEQVVAEYADLYHQGIQLPPVTVFYDGTDYWLADGFHRYWAQKKAGCDVVMADIYQGTQRDAILHAVGANAAHGLRRSNADKRKAVLIMLEDEEWAQWSTREIARQCGVSEKMARSLRASHTASKTQYENSERTFIHPRTGKPSKMKTEKIGRAAKSKATTQQSPRFGKNAYRPKRFHGETGSVPMRAISLPLNNPVKAARCMFGLYDAQYIRRMTGELVRIIREHDVKDQAMHDQVISN